ncbi:thymidylate kinase [Candidatus Parcubacteria bacterium]|nr:thymidylate kinase [Candidatus Parcubacteria bacterium]
MPWNSGNLIVIEGGDGAGKATQTRLLYNALRKSRKVTLFEFPRYKQSQFGRLVRRSLDGEFGDFLGLSPYFSSLPYVLDRTRAKYLLQEALKEGDVICDRYTPSNLAHQGAKLPKRERAKFVRFIEEGEYKELGLPAPDLVIYLWLPATASEELMKKRVKKDKSRHIDQHEAQIEYQKKVIEMYLDLVKARKNWHVVKCVNSKGSLRSRKDIHQEVLQIVKKSLKLRT